MTSLPRTAHLPRRLPGGVGGRVALVVGAAGLLIVGHWADPTQGTAITRSLTLAALPLVLPLARWAVPPAPGPGGYLALAGGVLAGPIYSLFYDPLRDADCPQCLPGAFAIIPDIATAQSLSLTGNVLVATGLLLAASRRPVAPAPAALAVLAFLPLLGHARAGALGGLAVPVLAWLGFLMARWWSAHQLSQLVTGLQDAEGLDPATLADLEARPGLSPQARLGLAQARLRLALSEQAAQIDESRRRIVARADQEARRLERDLHDGAQQYLLGLGMALLAEPQTPRTAQALKETHACIDDLRTVAREIYPPVLESGGLRPALSALARGRLAALDVPDRRFPAATERTAYLAVADILHRGSQPISVAGRVTGAELVVEVDGPPPPVEALIHDRVAATGGTLHVQECRTVMRLPCE